MGVFDGPELQRRPANFTPLSPVSILKRTERVHGGHLAQVHGTIRQNLERGRRAVPSARVRAGEAGRQEGRHGRSFGAEYSRRLSNAPLPCR